MKTKMSFKRAALPIIATLLVAVISLTGVTYAWFTSGTTATVDEIDIGVETAGGLQIAANASGPFTWGSSYTPDSSLQNLTFSPMSAAAAVNTTTDTLDFYQASLSDSLDKIYAFTKVNVEEEKNKSYISFDLYFRNPETITKNVNLAGSVVSALAKNSHQAVRIAFITQANVSSNATGVDASNFANGSFAVGSNLEQTVTIFEPNAGDHSTYGLAIEKEYTDTQSGAFEYKALTGTNGNNTDVYYNRYTGEGFKQEDARTEAADGGVADATGKYYLGAAVSGETMTPWTVAADYQKVTNAADLIASKAANVYFVAGMDAPITSEPTLITVTQEHVVDYTQYTYYVCKPVTTYAKQETSANLADVDTVTDASDTVFELQGQSVTKITVVIWMEGQDVECENNTSGEGFKVALKFNSANKE